MHHHLRNGIRDAAFAQGGTSVFRVAELLDEEVWELGDEHVAAVRGKDVIARANVLVSDVLEINLSVDPDDTPPRHANIAGWADSKSEIRQQALELAAKATLTRK